MKTRYFFLAIAALTLAACARNAEPSGPEGVQPDPDNIIRFEDPIAKSACVEKFDSNGDGEISYAEAAATTSLTGLFTNWNAVTSFDEIRYFTGVTSTENVFDGCSKLTHITIPDNITTLGTFLNCTALTTVELPSGLASLPAQCFAGCSSLKDVTLPQGITTIPIGAFLNCLALTTLEVPSSITSIGRCAFAGCTVLAGIELPTGLKSVGHYAFSSCTAITSMEFPASVTSLGEGTFAVCEALSSVVLPEDLTVLPAFCFEECTSLSSVTWPSALTTIGNHAFMSCDFSGSDYALRLPETVTSIGSLAFGNLKHLIIPSTTPVSIQSDSFKIDYTFLYVPAGMVKMYKVRTNWSKYADRIRPIDDYPLEPVVGGTVGEAVDLGLSVKWASWNVGASAPEEYGAYFAWGETTPKLWGYDSQTYKWNKGGYLTKYNTDSFCGTIDNKTTLDPEDDAAHANWGGNWRMPTYAEWKELKNNCTWTWTKENGVNGCRVTSNKEGYTDKSIFLPAAGSWANTTLDTVRSYGFFWSSSVYTRYPRAACGIYFNSGDVFEDTFSREIGKSVRPVIE